MADKSLWFPCGSLFRTANKRSTFPYLVDYGEVPLLGEGRDGAGDGGGAVRVRDGLLGAHERRHFVLDLIFVHTNTHSQFSIPLEDWRLFIGQFTHAHTHTHIHRLARSMPIITHTHTLQGRGLPSCARRSCRRIPWARRSRTRTAIAPRKHVERKKK